MAFQLTATAEILTEKRNISPNLIIEFENHPTMYSTLKTLKPFLFDDNNLFDDGLHFDKGVPDPNVKDLISFGTTGNTISQQLLQDKGGSSSVSSFRVDLIDKDQEITKLVSPGIVINELLGTKARVYLNFEGGIHPMDSILIHKGIIDEIAPGQASIMINIAHPESQKRQMLYPKVTTKLTAGISDTDYSIPLENVNEFILPTYLYQDSCVKIDNEVIKFNEIFGSNLISVTRGYLGTTPAAHSSGADVESLYVLKGNAIDLSLALMISGSDEYWASVPAKNIGAYFDGTLDPNVIYFQGLDIKARCNFTLADKITITNSLYNDFIIDVVITDYGSDENGSWIKVSSILPIVTELETTAIIKFKSKYRLMFEGMGMTPDDVDVDGHLKIKERYFSSLMDYEFYITEEINGKDFLSEQVYLPSGLYTLPRNARAGVGITLPPITVSDLPVLDENNITNIASIKQIRSTNKNFYNAVVFKFAEDLDGKFKKGIITYSAESQNRIKNTGTKPLSILAKGVRDNLSSTGIMSTNSRRIIERYQFGSELLQGVKLLFKDGFKLECGDVVLFGSPELNMVDISSGTRSFSQKAYEIVNKSINIKTGEVLIDLLATGFDLDGRYGLISPSSYLSTGSTTTALVLSPMLTTSIIDERKKWLDFIGEKVRVHNDDYSFSEEVSITGFDESDPFVMYTTALSTPPSSGYIVDIPQYDETNANTNYKYKIRYVHLNPTVSIASGTSGTVFNVNLADAGKFQAGQLIKLRKSDWSVVSAEVYITDVTSTQITVDNNLGFTPDSTYSIELIGFLDGGFPYRIL